MADVGISPQRDWNAARLEELIEHIVQTHHAWLRAELPQIEQQMAACPRALSGFRRFRFELENHLQKEEAVLFPLILRMEAAAAEGRRLPSQPFGPITNPIGMMEQEHGVSLLELAGLRTAIERCDSPAMRAKLAALDADMQLHIHLEDDILFPRATALERS